MNPQKEEDLDYEIVDRSETSVKYLLANIRQPGLDCSKAIYVSHADMEFKFAPALMRKITELNQKPHYGYNLATHQTETAKRNWVHERYSTQDVVIDRSTTMNWHGMLTVINAVIQAVTKPGDKVLIPCPNYYRFIMACRNFDRVPVGLDYEIRENRFYFNFQALEECIVKNDIKLMLFSSPANPSGRIWSRQELTRLKDIILKHNIILFSDEIFSDLVDLTPEQKQMGLKIKDVYTSMLSFDDMKDNLIYGCSFTKAFNCTSIGLAYSICRNPQIKNKLEIIRDKYCTWSSAYSYKVLEACYSSKEAKKWQEKTRKYIMDNFASLKKFAAEKIPKLHVFEMDSPYLCVVDFKEYGLAGEKLVSAFTKVNICPTFLDSAYVDTSVQRSLVRLNLGVNHKVMKQLLERLEQLVNDV